MERFTLLELHLHGHGDVNVGSRGDDEETEPTGRAASGALPTLVGAAVAVVVAAVAWRVLDRD